MRKHFNTMTLIAIIIFLIAAVFIAIVFSFSWRSPFPLFNLNDRFLKVETKQGEIIDVLPEEKLFTVKNKDDGEILIMYKDDTEFFKRNGKKAKPEDIRKTFTVSVRGSRGVGNTFEADEIIIFSEPNIIE